MIVCYNKNNKIYYCKTSPNGQPPKGEGVFGN